jgi:hypothetical protein
LREPLKHKDAEDVEHADEEAPLALSWVGSSLCQGHRQVWHDGYHANHTLETQQVLLGVFSHIYPYHVLQEENQVCDEKKDRVPVAILYGCQCKALRPIGWGYVQGSEGNVENKVQNVQHGTKWASVSLFAWAFITQSFSTWKSFP